MFWGWTSEWEWEWEWGWIDMGLTHLHCIGSWFAKGWILENKLNRPEFHAINEKEKNHPIEQVGKELRAMMPFVKPKSKKEVVTSAKD